MKKLLADAMLENEVAIEALQKKMVPAPARRELVRRMRTRGLMEGRSPAFVSMSASSLCYQPRPDSNIELRARIVALIIAHNIR